MDIAGLIKKINIKKIFRQLLESLYWKIGWILLFLFMLLSLYCVYVWYEFVYNPRWDEQKKQEYIRNKGLGINFDNAGFSRVIEEQKKRNVNYAQKIEGVNDIFGLKR